MHLFGGYFLAISELLSEHRGVFSGSQFQVETFSAGAPNTGSEELSLGDSWMQVSNHCHLGFWLHL